MALEAGSEEVEAGRGSVLPCPREIWVVAGNEGLRYELCVVAPIVALIVAELVVLLEKIQEMPYCGHEFPLPDLIKRLGIDLNDEEMENLFVVLSSRFSEADWMVTMDKGKLVFWF